MGCGLNVICFYQISLTSLQVSQNQTVANILPLDLNISISDFILSTTPVLLYYCNSAFGSTKCALVNFLCRLTFYIKSTIKYAVLQSKFYKLHKALKMISTSTRLIHLCNDNKAPKHWERCCPTCCGAYSLHIANACQFIQATFLMWVIFINGSISTLKKSKSC